MNDTPLENGTYIHSITCNAGRRLPVGNEMCSCGIGRRIRSLLHQIVELNATNHELNIKNTKLERENFDLTIKIDLIEKRNG